MLFLRSFLLLLVTVLGIGSAWAMPLGLSELRLQITTGHLTDQAGNPPATARAPPPEAAIIAQTGAKLAKTTPRLAPNAATRDKTSLPYFSGPIAPKGGANNINNGIRLNHQLAAGEIAGGHGFQKHVLEQGEFAGLGIRTRRQYRDHIENVLNNPSSIRYTSDGRSFHLQESTGTVVVRNPSAPDGGTAFQPQNWNDYVSGLPTRTEPY